MRNVGDSFDLLGLLVATIGLVGFGLVQKSLCFLFVLKNLFKVRTCPESRKVLFLMMRQLMMQLFLLDTLPSERKMSG
jgi:hypothetical protein